MADEPPKEEAKPAAPGGVEMAPGVVTPKQSFIGKLLGSKLVIPIVAVIGLAAGIGSAGLFGHKAPPPAEETANHKTEGEHSDGTVPDAPSPPDAHATEEAAAAEQAIEESASPEGPVGPLNEALVVKFDPLIVNIFEKNSIHYLKLTLMAITDKPEAAAELTAAKPMLVDRLIFIVGATSLREILSTGGKALMKEDILAAFNRSLSKGRVEKVLFTEFTIQ